MLFGLNTVSVLTLIDVPVCFPLLLQTESTHKSGYYRLGGVRQKQPFLQLFAHHSLLCLFLFSGFLEKDYDRKQRWTDGKRMTKKRVTEKEWELIYGGWQQRKREDKGGSHNQFNLPNWKYICQQAARWQVSTYCTGMFIRMSNNWCHKDIFVSPYCEHDIDM